LGFVNVSRVFNNFVKVFHDIEYENQIKFNTISLCIKAHKSRCDENMQQILLEIDEKRYSLMIQFLKTLDYVKIVQVEMEPGKTKKLSKRKAKKPALIAFENYNLPLSPGESFRRDDIYGEDGR